MIWKPTSTLIPVQVAIAVIALVVLTIWPPMSGKMLMIPLAGGGANEAARAAVAGGGVLLGAGPFPGSMVVIGERSRIADRARPWNFLILAAPPAGCGGGGNSGEPA